MKLFILTLIVIIFGVTDSFAQNACIAPSNENRMCQKITEEMTEKMTEERLDNLNIYGEKLAMCCQDPVTGFYRNGYCQTGASDRGTHVACAKVTQEFLEFSKSRGNDLTTPRPEFSFPGLKPGDKWCLCALRWTEALEAGVVPKLDLKATHQRMLEFVQREVLERYALHDDQAESEEKK